MRGLVENRRGDYTCCWKIWGNNNKSFNGGIAWVEMVKKVLITREAAGLLLAMSRELYPREMISTLHGRYKKGVVLIKEVCLVPDSVYGEGFASFNLYNLPIDLSFVGVAHSHPSGYGIPSHEDLIHMVGRVMIIVTAPYANEGDIHAYDSKGNRIEVEIVEDEGET